MRIAMIGVGAGGTVTTAAGGAGAELADAALESGAGVGDGSGGGAWPAAVDPSDPASSAATGKTRWRNFMEWNASI